MEQITRKGNVFYYGDRPCRDAEEAYRRYRADYHALLGRAAAKRLDRIGQRTERIHGSGFCFSEGSLPVGVLLDGSKVRCRMLGLVHTSYCRIVGLWDYSTVPDEQFDDWFDYVFSKGSGCLRTVGRKERSGRTSKRLKKRYR